MKTKLFVALTALIAVFSACQKDAEETTDTDTTKTEDYQPTTAGSTWQYNSTSEGVYTETALGTDTTIDGQKFFAFDNSATGRRYVNKNNGIYTSYGKLPQINTIDTTITLLYLKDAPVGTTWNNIGVYSGIPITLSYTVESRDADKVINGNTYKNVIALDYNIAAPNPLSGTTLTIATGKQYYAKGVGAILTTLHLDAAGYQVDDSTYLVSATIK